MSNIKEVEIMSNIKIEYKRFSTKMIDNIRELFNKLWKRSMAEVDLNDMEIEDIQLLKETSKLFKDILNESEDYITVLNYQVKLLEDVADEIRDMNDRLKRLEAKQ